MADRRFAQASEWPRHGPPHARTQEMIKDAEKDVSAFGSSFTDETGGNEIDQKVWNACPDSSRPMCHRRDPRLTPTDYNSTITRQ